MTALPSTPEMYDLRMSEKVRPLFEAVTSFIANEIEPATEEFFRLGEGRDEHWGYGDGQLELLESLRPRRKRLACGTSSFPTPRVAKASPTLITPISRLSWARTRSHQR